jgi:hypothetical protein
MIVFGRTASSRVLRHFWKDRKKAVFLCFHCVNWRIENTASDGPIENFQIFCCGASVRFWQYAREGADHLWRKNPPRNLSISLVGDEQLDRVTGG